MARLGIFSQEEQKLFNSPPVFNSIERKRYFTFPDGILKRAHKLDKPHNKVYFLLMYGYFKAANKFYQGKFHQKDITYVAGKLDSIGWTEQAEEYKRRTYRNHREAILTYTGRKKFDLSAEQLLAAQLTPMVRSHVRPKLMLQQACDILIKNKTEIPSYHRLSTIISREMKQHRKALNRTIHQSLTKECKALIDTLLHKENGSRYRLTLLKRFSHSPKPAKIKSNIADLRLLQGLFQTIEPVITSLQLTNEGMKYYAYAAMKFKIFQMLERADTERYLYLLAFIAHQYYILQDLLIEVLIQAVAGAETHTTKQQKETTFLVRKTRSQTVQRVVGSYLSTRQLVRHIHGILQAQELTDSEKVHSLQKLFANKNNQEEQELEGKAQELQKESTRILKDEDYYDALEEQSLRLQNRVSEIVKQMRFNEGTSNTHIVAAIAYFRQKDGEVGNTAPVEFLKPEEQERLFDAEGKLRVSLYKILLFTHIALQVKAGGLNVRNSYRFRSFDEYLIPEAKWQATKQQLLEQAGLTALQYFSKLIKHLAESLHTQYEKTNRHILNGRNPYIKVSKNGAYTLTTPKEELEEVAENTIADLFPKSYFIPLCEVLAAVHHVTGYLDVFTHWQTTHVGGKPSAKT
jgi:hypothetical protein